MMVVLNPYAGGGTAESRWRSVRGALPLREPVHLCTLGKNVDLFDVVHHALHDGERDFIAAGGDGTMNALVNALIPCLQNNGGADIRCGAVGLGSSNDFHKPFDGAHMIGAIPYKMDLTEARLRDVGVARFQEEQGYRERFFLINASVGMTASANDFFNHPDGVLRLLKRSSSGTAIMYAAVRTILGYRNRRVYITEKRDSAVSVNLTNLALVKSPHVSGSLRYDCVPRYASGNLRAYLCSDFGVMARFELLRRLSRGQFVQGGGCCAWDTSGIAVRAHDPFCVEIDGEVITTQNVHFSILRNYLKVCP